MQHPMNSGKMGIGHGLDPFFQRIGAQMRPIVEHLSLDGSPVGKVG